MQIIFVILPKNLENGQFGLNWIEIFPIKGDIFEISYIILRIWYIFKFPFTFFGKMYIILRKIPVRKG